MDCCALCQPYFSGFVRGLSLLLQGPSQDVITAYNGVSLVVEELKSTRKSSETAFQDIRTKASAMANRVDVELSVPRKCGKQAHRNNVVAGSASEYFKRSVFYPLPKSSNHGTKLKIFSCNIHSDEDPSFATLSRSTSSKEDEVAINKSTINYQKHLNRNECVLLPKTLHKFPA